MAKLTATIKIKDEVSSILKEINNNCKQIHKLMKENAKLLEKVIKHSIEVK